jgi:hypothetical protein
MADTEGAAETEEGVEAALFGDFGDAGGRHAEESAGTFEAQFAHVFAQTYAAGCAEAGAQVARAHAEFGGKLADRGGGGTEFLRRVVDLEFESGAGAGGGRGGAAGWRCQLCEEKREAQLGQALVGEIALGAQQGVELAGQFSADLEDDVAEWLHRDALRILKGDEEPVKFFVGVRVMVILIRKDHQALARGEGEFAVVGADHGFAAQGNDEHMAMVHGAAGVGPVEFGARASLKTNDVFRQGRGGAPLAVERAVGAGQPARVGRERGEGAGFITWRFC